MTMLQIPQVVTELKITQDDQQLSKRSLYLWWTDSWRLILSEFLATLMLVLFGCMSCLPMEGIDTNIYAPFGFGFVVMINIQIFGHLSGCYMNPVVTTATIIWGRTPVAVGVMYILAEFVGALLGYGILIALSPLDLVANNVCVPIPYVGLTDLQSVGLEAVLTGTLILLNCGLWDPINASDQDSSQIKYGLTVVGLSLAGGSLTGATMNPARTLGIAIWTGYWAHHWVYWVGPFSGGIVAVLFYKNVFLGKEKKREVE